jgi:hypothetical protein
MPTGTTANLAELLTDLFEPKFTDAMNRSNFMLQRFSRATGSDTKIQWKVHYAGNESAGSYSENDPLPTPGVQSYTEAVIPYRWNWIHYGTSGQIEEATKGKGGYFEALASEAKEASEDLKNELNNQILATSKANATDLDGIGVIVSGTGVYADIDRATNAYWRSYVLDNGGIERDLSIELMQQVSNALAQPDRRAKVTALLTSFTHFDDYGNLLQVYRRYVNDFTMDGGHRALDFKNKPLVGVEGMPNGDLYFLDESEWEYNVLLNYKTEEKDVQADAKRFMIKHYSALRCKHPGRQGRITDLAG